MASGAITHCCLRCGCRKFFLASGRSCCRSPCRRCSIRPPSPPEGAGSIWRIPRAALRRQRDQRGFRRAVELPRPSRYGLYGRGQNRLETFHDERLAGPARTVALLVSNGSAIRLSLHASPKSETSAFNKNPRSRHQLRRNACPCPRNSSSCFRSSATEPHNVLLDADFLQSHELSPSSQSQQHRFREISAKSMKRATRFGCRNRASDKMSAKLGLSRLRHRGFDAKKRHETSALDLGTRHAWRHPSALERRLP